MEEPGEQYPRRGQIEGYALKYRLVLPQRQQAARIGDLLGRRTGSSIEYQDRRDYVQGDDLRYIDWRGFARNDRLTVKLYREEICPNVDIIVDTSLSMAVTPEKALRRMDLAYLFFLLAGKIHAATALFDLADRMRRLRNPLDLIRSPGLRQDTPLPLLANSGIARRGGIKILISDFLFPFSPSDLVAMFNQADRLALIQVVSEFEDHPEPGGPIRLEDAESGDYLDVALTPANIREYRARLERLRDDLQRLLKTRGGAFAVVRESDSLDLMMRKLLEKEMVEV